MVHLGAQVTSLGSVSPEKQGPCCTAMPLLKWKEIKRVKKNRNLKNIWGTLQFNYLIVLNVHIYVYKNHEDNRLRKTSVTMECIVSTGESWFWSQVMRKCNRTACPCYYNWVVIPCISAKQCPLRNRTGQQWRQLCPPRRQILIHSQVTAVRLETALADRYVLPVVWLTCQHCSTTTNFLATFAIFEFGV